MSEALRTYAGLSHRLDRSIAAGQGDGDESESIRDAMYAPWDALTESENPSADSARFSAIDSAEFRPSLHPANSEMS